MSEARLVADWQRWQLAALDSPAAPEATAACDVDLAAARQAGFDAGWRDGEQQGRVAGFQTGHDAGLEVGRAEGYAAGQQTGHAAGYQAGLAEGQVQSREHAERIAALAGELAQSLHVLAEDTGQALLALALAVAQKIVGDTVATQPEAVLHGVREVLRLGCDTTAVCVVVHPDDYTLVNAYLADTSRSHDWRVVADATVARGGCRTQTALGEIDATLQTRWQQVAAALLGTSDRRTLGPVTALAQAVTPS